MTVKELCALEGVSLCYFDGSEWHSPGFFYPALKVLAIDINLSEQDQKQVALHELGHKEHTPVQYEVNRELCELQADRNMIHYLLEEELKIMDDVSEFNYVHFMEKYKLKTIADETMVKEEYKALLN
ncbi:ImmA/IrrE family metallo-endopeptidase [uncultured Streptococcus sp.]|uniref:ImmA/IrrE family metallo-endopeptidase n=1 Tax=uncultured Streptococcus sp. TaxID=83427 RepID=UPI003211AF45